MRVLTLLLALAFTPFIAGVSQSAHGSNCDNGQGDVHRSAQGQAHAHHGQCLPPTTGGCVVTPPFSAGTVFITGTVYDASTSSGLSGWCVVLSGSATATVVTDASGTYTFSGLPAGTYTVCEVVSSGWHETFPGTFTGVICPNGFPGWSFALASGEGASFIDFGNLIGP
jgi:hypothetical protein